MILEIIRAVVGFLLVLFIPGFAATYALFPKNDELDEIERIALSIGLSIALVVLTIAALNMATGMLITATNSLLVILLMTLALSVIAYIRRT